MPWRYHSDDNKIEVIVEPNFRGDLVALASVRPVWIVDTPLNRPRIDAIWSVGANANLYEVNRYRYQCDELGSDDRAKNFGDILNCLDDHYHRYDLVVHGIPALELGAALLEEGFRMTETTEDGFVAEQIAEVRDGLIGRA
jgi:hypothetical protein